jgi:hypothetical protein
VIEATIKRVRLEDKNIYAYSSRQVQQDDDQAKSLMMVNSAVIIYADGDSQNSVTQDIALCAVGALHNSEITWESDNEELVSISDTVQNDQFTAVITRPAALGSDVDVQLTATAALGDNTSIKTFTLRIKKIEGTPQQQLQADLIRLVIVYQPG